MVQLLRVFEPANNQSSSSNLRAHMHNHLHQAAVGNFPGICMTSIPAQRQSRTQFHTLRKA